MAEPTTPPARTRAAKTEPKMNRYVVNADAIVLSTGQKTAKGKPEVMRLVRGSTLTAPANHPAVLEHLALGGIRLVSSKAERDEVLSRRFTVRLASEAQGAQGDPVQAPDPAVAPLTPQSH